METFLIDDFRVAMPEIRLGADSEARRFHTLRPGAARHMVFKVTTDPHRQRGSVSIVNGLFLLSSGFKVMDGLSLSYGGAIGGKGANRQLMPLCLDITQYKELVIHFAGSTQDLNMNVVVFSNSGRTAWAENRQFIKPHGVSGTTVGLDNAQEVVISTSVFTEQAPTHPSYNPKDIHVLHLGIQNLGYQGGHAFALDKIELR